MSRLVEHAFSLQLDVALLFIIIAIMFTLFIYEPIRLDVTALGVLVTLVLFEPWLGVTPHDAVAGFASEATLTVFAFFIISQGVKQTGIVHYLGRIIQNRSSGSYTKQLLSLTGVSGLLSGAVNNTPIVGIMIPMASDIAESAGRSPSKYLMPLSFAAICGGQLTLIASTSNLLANDLAGRTIGYSFGMFEFAQLGLLILVVCILYLLTIGRFILPDHDVGDGLLHFDLKDYLTEITVTKGSELIDKPVSALQDVIKDNIDIVMVDRDGEQFYPPFHHLKLQIGDDILVRSDREGLHDIIDSERLQIEAKDGKEHEWIEEKGAYSIFPISLPPGSSLIGKTLSSIEFRSLYEGTVLGIRRRGEALKSRIEDLILQEGDMMLVQASKEQMRKFQNNDNFIVSGGHERSAYQPQKAPLALAILGLVIGTTALGWLDIHIAALGGVVLMVGTGILSAQEMYNSVDWEVIILIAGVIPLGVAMAETGAAAYLAEFLAISGNHLPAIIIAFSFYILATALTNLVNDNASVVLLVPIAVEIARSIGASPISFILIVIFAAGNALMTPVGFQTNLMVMGPGGYTFTDYLRVGGLLQLLLAITATAGIALIWGF